VAKPHWLPASPQFTNVCYDDFRVVLNNLAGGNAPRAGPIPYCLFTDSELAHVGMSETEAIR
jgi:pyruvate/2-oxoglutarate dehydrogenase complex dihydrolipoamide dehydrogenase (E3) component